MQVRSDNALTTIQNILLLAIVIIAGALILAYLLGFLTFLWGTSPFPSPIQIYGVYHTHDIHPNSRSDSRVVLINNSDIEYPNKDLMANFLRNGQEVHACINTLNGHLFIPTAHNGVQWMGGPGCSDSNFSPHETIVIDFTDDTFRMGDLVTVTIYQRCNGPCKKEVITFSLLDDDKINGWLNRNIYHMNGDYSLISCYEYTA